MTKKELERRWIVTLDPNICADLDLQTFIRAFGKPQYIEQGYFDRPYDDIVRVRIIDGKRSILGSKLGIGEVRDEDEERTSLNTGRWLYRRCNYFVKKYRFAYGGWEIDLFMGPLVGLVIAEYERCPQESREIDIPSIFSSAIEVTNTLSNYHLARMAYDLEMLASNKPIHEIILAKRIPKVVLTSAPCCGKTTIVTAVQKDFADQVHCIPEVASILISRLGITPDPSDESRYIDFQRRLARIQLDFEGLSERQADVDGKRLVLLDRGLRDNGAYMPGGWPRVKSLIPLQTHEDELYNDVIILGLPSEEVYNEHRFDNPARPASETYERARELDRAIRHAWNGHRNVHLVNGASMEEKMEGALNIIRSHAA